MSSTSNLVAVWIKVLGAGAQSVTSVRCDPALTTIDDLKKLVKAKYSRKLDHIAAPDLIVKGADGIAIEEDTFISERKEGPKKNSAFVIELPVAGSKNINFVVIHIVVAKF